MASYKRIALIAAIVVTSTLMWAVALAWLQSPVRFTSLIVMIWPSIAFVVVGAVAGVAWALLDRWQDRLIAMLGSWVTFMIFWKPDIWYFSVLPLFLWLWYEGARRIHNDLHDRHTIRMNVVLGNGVKFILLGAFLMVSLGYYLLSASHPPTAKGISTGIQGAVAGQLPPSQQQQFRQNIANSIDTTVRQWFGILGPFIPPALAFVLFVTLWSVAFIYRPLAAWLGLGIFVVLKKTGFVKIEEQSVQAETLRL